MQRFEFFESQSLCTSEIQKALSTHISSSYKKKVGMKEILFPYEILLLATAN